MASRLYLRLKDTHTIVDRFANADMGVNANLNDIADLLEKEYII
jgi:hypothetical protein